MYTSPTHFSSVELYFPNFWRNTIVLWIIICWKLCLVHAVVSNFSDNFGAFLSIPSEDNWFGSGVRGRCVPLKCLNHTSRPTDFLLIYPCCLFKRCERFIEKRIMRILFVFFTANQYKLRCRQPIAAFSGKLLLIIVFVCLLKGYTIAKWTIYRKKDNEKLRHIEKRIMRSLFFSQQININSAVGSPQLHFQGNYC